MIANKKKKIYLLFFAFFALILIFVEIGKAFGVRFSSDETLHEIIYAIISRAVGSAICILMMSYCSLLHLFSLDGKNKIKNFILLIPCWLVVINNFPFISVMNGTASVDAEIYAILLYALQCFMVGLFEEVAFRGCVFMLILQSKHKTRKEIFLSILFSSMIFGVIHIANLLAGASPLPVIQQVGYSFLIGSMCAVVLLITKKLWACIWMHSLFNFAGGLVPTLGSGEIWNTPTIVFTAVLAVVVTVYMTIIFLKYDFSSLKNGFFNEEDTETNVEQA